MKKFDSLDNSPQHIKVKIENEATDTASRQATLADETRAFTYEMYAFEEAE